MTRQISSQRALEDLSAIKKIIDTATGARIFSDAFLSMGTLMVAFGVIVPLMCGVNYHVVERFGVTPTVVKSMLAMWVGMLLLLGAFKWVLFGKKSKEAGISLWEYVHKLMAGSFLEVDLPVELASTFLIIFAFKTGHPLYIVPAIAMFVGIVIAILGPIFREKGFTVFGYIYIALGGLGLLFMRDHLLVFVAVVYGLFSVVAGLLMRSRYKQLCSKHAEESQGI